MTRAAAPFTEDWKTGLWPSSEAFLPADVLAAIEQEAASADERGELSQSSLDRLRQAGYFGLAVPVELSGSGAGLLQCAAVQRRLAMADPGLAIAVNMHLFSVGMGVEHWRRRRESCGLILEAIATQHRIVASAFAEPGLGGTILRSTVKARRTHRGYVVSGVKSPCSLANECDLVSLQMEIEPVEPDGLLLAMIPARIAGVRATRTWDAMGMRGSGSDTLTLDGCFVPDELVFHRCNPGFDDDDVFASGLVWFCVTTTATYLGIVQAVMADTAAALHRARRLDAPSSSRASSPTVQGALGEIAAGTLAIESACSGLASRMDVPGCDARTLLAPAIALKHEAVDVCVRAVEGCAELAGGGSYRRSQRWTRFWRDVQAVRYHPPTRLVSRQLLGRWALKLPLAYELDERAP